MTRFVAAPVLLLLALGACGGEGTTAGTQAAARIRVVSPAFSKGSRIPPRFTCEGANLSPPLAWRGPPAREHALTVTDPDAGGFVHWVVYGLPGSTVGLREGRLPQGTRTGTNGFGDTGYGGPCPPRGDESHRYVFTLYALDEPVGLAPGATLSELLGAIDCCVKAKGSLIASFARS